MAFPDAPRVRYEVNTLDEVICQLRFPPILRIDAEAPSAFQERIRQDFPYYELKVYPSIPQSIPADIAKLMRQDFEANSSRTHWFGSADAWWAGLTRDTLSLHCRNYTVWEEFRTRLDGPFQALLQEYRPALFSHVCLRYRNAVRRSRLPDPDAPWSNWLQPWVCGPLGNPDAAGVTEGLQVKATILLPGEIGRVGATYGLAEETNGGGTFFAIDAHVHSDQRTEPTHAFDRLDALHHQAGLFFRWCITDQLHEALRPRRHPLDET